MYNGIRYRKITTVTQGIQMTRDSIHNKILSLGEQIAKADEVGYYIGPKYIESSSNIYISQILVTEGEYSAHLNFINDRLEQVQSGIVILLGDIQHLEILHETYK